MQTAVEQLMIALYEGGYLRGNGNEMDDILEKYKEMEKQQIIDAAERWKGTDFAEKYYAETYGSKGSDDHRHEHRHSVYVEISDEEINKITSDWWAKNNKDPYADNFSFSAGMRMYREQLKKKTK